MKIICLGLSHRTAPVELRERLSFPPAALGAALARYGCGDGVQSCSYQEVAILSTCNRLELYAVTATAEEDFEPFMQLLVERSNLPRAQFENYLYRYTQDDAALHLCRVAAGLDSMVLGEPQILGQVTDAYAMALGQGAAGPVLSALFRAAIHAGKRARTETGISRNPSSISAVAVKLAENLVRDLTAARVLILGAGEMAELAVASLHKRGVRGFTVANRTYARAEQLAQRWDGQAVTFERLVEALAEADIVIASTGAPPVLVRPAMAREAMLSRPDRPLVFIDIALPRDVDPEVAAIPNVYCYDLDALQAHLDRTVAQREREVPLVEAIAAEEAREFGEWLHGLDILPVIAGLRAKADEIRRAEVEKTLRHLPNLDESERRRIEALTEALVNKLLHEPTRRLKAEAGNGHAANYAAAVRYLFGLY